MKKHRWLLLSTIIIVLLASLGYGIYWWEKRGEGFRPRKIKEAIVFDSRWDVVTTPEELKNVREIFSSQKFFYLGHGFQCYAFASDDGKYVVKFFRYQRLRLPALIQALPSLPYLDEWRKERIVSLHHRRESLLRSCITSWNLAKRETALLYVHLNETKDLIGRATIVDLLGNEYTLPMDEYRFMVQRKALHIKPEIDRLMASNNVEGAKRRLDQIFELIIDCARNNVQDLDGALIRKNNLGFLGDRAIYIDGGKLVRRESSKIKACFQKDLKRLRPLVKWLKEQHPILVDYFEAKQEQVVRDYDQLLLQKPRLLDADES